MLDYTNCNIKDVAVHFVGNKTNDEDLRVSKSLLDISDVKVRDLLFKFFTTPFSDPEFYSFTFSNEDFTLNPIYSFASQMFDVSKSFQKNATNIAKHLYETSLHPQIKSGDLFVVYFEDVALEDELVDAIGIFKSENRQAFLKLDKTSNDYSAYYDEGINIEKLDKGCLILNSDRDSGLRVCIIDKSNKSTEAQYWKDGFLQIKDFSDNYRHTKELLAVAKNFVTKRLKKDFEVSKRDQIDLLNRSVDYFKNNEIFDKKDFEKTVFQDKEMIKAFQSYGNTYQESNGIGLTNNFEISTQAVKKESRVLRNVLKLDKNFDVYIHGNMDMIERGTERDGRKFYKLYFENEM